MVLGAGSAGCAIASRLSEDPDTSVALIEAGAAPGWRDFRIHIPAAKGMALKSPRYSWMYDTVPQGDLNNRTIRLHQGKIAGGSSAINGMVWVRGNPRDYDSWAENDPGLEDWKFEAVRPYFERSETHTNRRGRSRQCNGPMQVQAAEGLSPLSEVFVEAAVAAGHDFNEDVNGSQQEGFGLLDMTVHKGRRVTSWSAYLQPARRRINLTVITMAQAAELVFDKTRCCGAAYVRNGMKHQAIANREVILCLGAIGSPTTLMRSGIGPADDLHSLGIKVRHDLVGVGRNLHDHMQISVISECLLPVTIQPLVKKSRYLPTALRWLLTRTGEGATNHFEAGGFVRSDSAATRPEIHFLFSPHAFTRFDDSISADDHGFQVHTGPLHPRSRGRLRLRSDRLADHPIIDPRYLSDPYDWEITRNSLELAREILAQKPFDRFRGKELFPGVQVRTDAEIDKYTRETANTGYHVCGTCKMGTGPDAVVGNDLKVHGVEGLRVADASVMPAITSGNTHAPVLMIAEKASDLIRGSRAP